MATNTPTDETNAINVLEGALDDLRNQIPDIFQVNVAVDLWGYVLHKEDDGWKILDVNGDLVGSADNLSAAIEAIQDRRA